MSFFSPYVSDCISDITYRFPNIRFRNELVISSNARLNLLFVGLFYAVHTGLEPVNLLRDREAS